MKKKIVLTLIAITMLIQYNSIPSVHAGSRDRHLIEGAIIGTSAAIIGASIAKQNHRKRRREHVHKPCRKNPETRWHSYQYEEPRGKRHFKKRHHKKGHWTMQKRWVAPVYRQRWNPGHYNGNGRWVEGRHERVIVQEGYWEKQRVWVRR